MSLSFGPALGLLVDAATGESHDTAFRAFLRGVDGLVQAVVKQVNLNTPPGSPSNGDAYVVGTSPTGAWASSAAKIARYSTALAAWEYYTPKQGWNVYDQTTSTSYEYNGSAWSSSMTIGGNLTALAAGTHSFGSNAGGNVTIQVNRAAGSTGDVTWSTASGKRWIGRCSADGEIGSDQGSTWNFYAMSDAGSSIDGGAGTIQIYRYAGGSMTFGGSSTRPAIFTGGMSVQKFATKTTTYTVVNSDFGIDADGTGAAFTITLPAAPTAGLLITITKIDSSANAITISSNGKNINGAASISLAAQWNKAVLWYNGTTWRQVA